MARLTGLTLSLAIGLTAAAISIQAQAAPTARRVYLLCEAEDPACPALIRQAYDDFLANPTVTECSTINYGKNSTFDAKRNCWNVTSVCHVTGPQMDLQDVYLHYMQTFPARSLYWESAPRVMMFMAMNMLGLCA